MTREERKQIEEVLAEAQKVNKILTDLISSMEGKLNVDSANHIGEKEVSEFLITIGIPCSILGYKYLKSAIKHAIKDPSWTDNITKGVYPDIANEYGTTATRVERAIRHAIESSWSRGDIKTLHEVFGNSTSADKGKPTNSEFICCVAEYLKLRRTSSKK